MKREKIKKKIIKLLKPYCHSDYERKDFKLIADQILALMEISEEEKDIILPDLEGMHYNDRV